MAEITVSQFEEGFPYLHNGRGNSQNTSTSQIYKKQKTTVGAAGLTKLCMVRGMSSRTSTSSSSPTRGVISVSQSVNLFRLRNRQTGENRSHVSKHVFSILTKAGASAERCTMGSFNATWSNSESTPMFTKCLHRRALSQCISIRRHSYRISPTISCYFFPHALNPALSICIYGFFDAQGLQEALQHKLLDYGKDDAKTMLVLRLTFHGYFAWCAHMNKCIWYSVSVERRRSGYPGRKALLLLQRTDSMQKTTKAFRGDISRWPEVDNVGEDWVDTESRRPRCLHPADLKRMRSCVTEFTSGCSTETPRKRSFSGFSAQEEDE